MRACVYQGMSRLSPVCNMAIRLPAGGGTGAAGVDTGHAAPQEIRTFAAMVMAAESVRTDPATTVTVVPDVMPGPEMMQPTQGGGTGGFVKVRVVVPASAVFRL